MSGRSGWATKCHPAAGFRLSSSEPSMTLRLRCRWRELQDCPGATRGHAVMKAIGLWESRSSAPYGGRLSGASGAGYRVRGIPPGT